MFETEGASSITTPNTDMNCLSDEEEARIARIDVLRESTSLGYDIFVEA